MKVNVEYKKLLLGLQQTAGALVTGIKEGSRMKLNLTIDYVESTIYMEVKLFMNAVASEPDVTARAFVPVYCITDNNDYIIKPDIPQPVQYESVAVSDIIKVFNWVKTRPQKYEYLTIAIKETWIYLEHCNKGEDYYGKLITTESASILKTVYEDCPNIVTMVDRLSFLDTIDGEIFLNTLDILYPLISDLPSDEGIPQGYIYFLNGTAKASDGASTFACVDNVGIENDFVIKAVHANYLAKMAKQCHAEFLRDYMYNDFIVKIGVLNPETCLITFVGVNDSKTRIYGNMAFPKIELDNIDWHNKVTDTVFDY